jgi:hypothetical protein
MKKLLFFLSLIVSLTSIGQVYDPSLHTVSNKAYGQAQAAPTDARTMFYDEDNFVYRAYTDTAEVKAYLSLAKYRTGGFDILVNTGGTLGLNGVITGGTNAVWYFKDGTDDDDLVIKGGGISGVAWGDISGTLSLQTDLNAALVALVPLTRTLTINGVAQTLEANRTWTIPTIQSLESGSGLTAVNDSTLKIGGNLSATETIGNSSQDFGLIITRSGASSSSTLQLVSQTGTGLSISSNSGTGITVTSTSGTPALFATNPSTTNTIVEISRFRRNSSGTAATGIGGYNNYTLETSDGTEKDAMHFNWRFTTATTGTQAAAFDVVLARGDNNSLSSTNPQLTIDANGKHTLTDYGDGLFTGTVTKWAAFTGTGELVEVDPPSGGSGDASDLITGTLADARLSSNVPLKNAANTFSSTNDFAGITATSISVGTVDNTEFSYLNGVSSAIQTQLDLKATLASPTFTGTVVLPSTTSIGTTSSTEIGYVDGVTSAIQTQIDTKAPTISPTFTGTVTIPAATQIEGTVISKDYGRKAMEALGSAVKAITVGTDAISNVTTTAAMVDGTRLFNAVWLNTAETITGVKFYQGTQGSFTGDNFNGIGLYSYSGGTLTQVAVTANDANIWKGSSASWQTVAFTTPAALQPGIYFYCFMYSNSAETTAPTIGCAQAWGASGMPVGDFTNSAKLTCNQTSQTTMPASVAMTSLSGFTTRQFAMLY